MLPVKVNSLIFPARDKKVFSQLINPSIPLMLMQCKIPTADCEAILESQEQGKGVGEPWDLIPVLPWQRQAAGRGGEGEPCREPGQWRERRKQCKFKSIHKTNGQV